MLTDVAAWFRGVFDFLGIFPRDAKICFLGLDNSGKTTLLQMLKENRVARFNPTVHPQSEELLINNIRFRTFDLGGHETARRIWRDYYATVDGLVFIVDAADRTRFAEAAEELHRLLSDPALDEVPIAVLGNKIDIPIAVSEDELRQALGLPWHLTSGKDDANATKHDVRTVEVFMCSVVRRMGYAEAFDWLGRRVV
mmetsp:Transcript_39714/g.127262  ORF Transcript_39714/g.127262 Transcript_39714/m.127262 type:complete len:197 (+) Transcript_39714:86-676(+)